MHAHRAHGARHRVLAEPRVLVGEGWEDAALIRSDMKTEPPVTLGNMRVLGVPRLIASWPSTMPADVLH
jgi:hypothetical protein